MSKAIQGLAVIGAAAGIAAAVFFTGGAALVAAPWLATLGTSLFIGGVSMEAGAIADALTSNRGQNITTRQPAAFRQIIYGMQRVGGVMVYESTTGSKHDQFNYVIVVATHAVESFLNLYLDGRQVFWSGTYPDNPGNPTIAFGGPAANHTANGPNGQTYNFGGLVFCSPWYGDQPDGSVDGNLTANDPTWAASGGKSPWLGGCAYMYLKVEYDQGQFPNQPEIRCTINGKNNIFDPRTGTSGFTTNWALVIADMFTDTTWGVGANVNQTQLIAAANVCDEQITLAAGGTEAQYTLNWHYDTSVAPGDAINTALNNAAGRVSFIGGEWYIWPAYWQGPSFEMSDSIIIDRVNWKPTRQPDELCNRVAGTYVAPNFPYNVAGNLYDANGWYDGTEQDNFPFAFQPTNFPQYAADTLHGFPSDAYLTEDGQQLPKEIALGGCLSIAQAQRVAKINLLRNRQQGSGTFMTTLAGFQLQPTDVITLTTATLGWTNKVLEIVGVNFVCQDAHDQGDPAPQMVACALSVIETDQSVYEWTPSTDELSIYDVPMSPLQAPYTIASPTDMVLTSGASTAVISANGQVTPRILVSWTQPQDIRVTQIQVQFRPSGTSTWDDGNAVDVSLTQAYVSSVVAGVNYDVQIRSLTATGASSDWVVILDYTVSITLNVQGTDGVAENALTGETYSSSSAAIIVSPFSAIIGNFDVSCLPAGSHTITTDGTIGGTGGNILPLVEYFVYYVDPTFVGGAITPIATTHTSDFDNMVGYFLIGAITPNAYSSGSGGGGGTDPGTVYKPSNFSDSGTRSTSNPTAPYTSTSSYAIVSASATYTPPPGGVGSGTNNSTYGSCIWEDFPATTIGYNATLNVTVEALSFANSGGFGGSVAIAVTIAGTQTTFETLTAGNGGFVNYTTTIPSGTNLSTVLVTVTVLASCPTSGTSSASQSVSAFVQQIYIN